MKIKVLKDSITNKINSLKIRSSNLEPFFRMTVLPFYRQKQGERWQTQGQSQGSKWDEYKNPGYKDYKQRKYADFLGRGKIMMVATSRLLGSALGPGDNPFGGRLLGEEDHRRIIEPRKMLLQTATPYAGFASEKRDIFGFNPTFWKEIKSKMAKYIARGINK
jgi:hypothetical protein